LSFPGSIVFRRSQASQSFSSPSLRNVQRTVQEFLASGFEQPVKVVVAGLEDGAGERFLPASRRHAGDFAVLDLERQPVALEEPIDLLLELGSSCLLVMAEMVVTEK